MENFQVLADCPSCCVEGSVIEIYDQGIPCCHFGVALESRCRLCGLALVGVVEGEGELPTSARHPMTEERCPRCRESIDGPSRAAASCAHCGLRGRAVQSHPATSFETIGALSEALARWAAEESFESVEEMLEASFEGIGVEEMHARILNRERVETTFDVLGFLFAHMGGGGGTQTGLGKGGDDAKVVGGHGETPRDEAWGFAPTARIQLPSGRAPHRRNRALALISVMAADGQIRPLERQFIERMLTDEGLDPLDDAEIRIHRPHEVGPVGSLKDREALLERMIDLAHIDGEKDETEMKVIREFGRAWGIDPARISVWERGHADMNTTRLGRFFIKLKALFLA